MPITKSAKRAERRSQRRAFRNRARKVTLEEALKAFQRRPTEAHRQAAQQLVDKNKKWRVISGPRAARLVSRLYRKKTEARR